ncbi:hypothetical protein [Paraburkholderia bannensis]|uniref:hypothetical protein n=1 Tax=Paraburkholderia bannensis TaxID=765414 RepID=UPI002ABDA62B|nr:hypothetical protein [Paraburkholderia bannensis]
MAAHADDFGSRDNGAPAQWVPHAQGQQWDRQGDHRDDSRENRGEQHAQTHRDDRHDRERAAHWRDARRHDAHDAHEQHGQREDSGSVFDSRRSGYHS